MSRIFSPFPASICDARVYPGVESSGEKALLSYGLSWVGNDAMACTITTQSLDCSAWVVTIAECVADILMGTLWRPSDDTHALSVDWTTNCDVNPRRRNETGVADGCDNVDPLKSMTKRLSNASLALTLYRPPSNASELARDRRALTQTLRMQVQQCVPLMEAYDKLIVHAIGPWMCRTAGRSSTDIVYQYPPTLRVHSSDGSCTRMHRDAE